MKCSKCSKKTNRSDLKGIPSNDWPLSKPKIKWFCSKCYQGYKANQKINKDLETKLQILEIMIERLGEEVEFDSEIMISAFPEYRSFIEKHKKMSFWELRAVERAFEKRKNSGTNVYEQTKIIRPGEFFA